MTSKNRITAFSKNTEILAGQVLEENSPGSLVRSVHLFRYALIMHACSTNGATDWTFYFLQGTLLDQPTLYEDDVNNPESLQR